MNGLILLALALGAATGLLAVAYLEWRRVTTRPFDTTKRAGR